MDKFTGIRLYFRDTNKWSNFLKLHAGFDVNFVLDKTTDSANISFIVQDEPEYLQINMWVALFINSNKSDFEFYKDGTPKNHEQFIVGGYQYYKTLAGYEVTMKLIEPIERFRGVLGETLSYTNQTSKVQDDITYIKEHYNYYTALKRWLQVTPANTDNISRDSDNKDSNGIAWWNRITILDKDFLSGLPFADNTLNELSLYDLLLDVYDSGTGRTPVAYFDLNTTTGMPQRLDRDEYLLKFIRQDGEDKPILEWDSLTENKGSGEVCSGVMKREDGANYATGLVSNVSNLSSDIIEYYPSQDLYAVPEALNLATRYTEDLSAGAENWGLRLPYKIKDVIKLEKMEVNGIRPKLYVGVELWRRITEKTVKEDKERNAWMEVSNIEYFYSEGDNIIYLNDYKYEKKKTEGADKAQGASWLYRIEYVPLIDARICVGESEFVQQINQTASQVDSNKFGKFMEKYLAGMGKADYTIQRTTEQPQDFINFIGSRVRRGRKTYMITNIALRNRNFQYDLFFQLNENHLRKNMTYQAPQNIRANTAIQYENISDRRTNLDIKLLMGIKPVKRLANFDKIIPNAAVLLNIFGANCDEAFFPQAANITNRFKIKTGDGKIDDNLYEFSSPIIKFTMGNQVSMNIQFYDNATAGVKREVEEDVIDPFNRVYRQIPVLYTDPFGEVLSTKIDIVNVAGDKFFDIDVEALEDDDNYKYALSEFIRTLDMQKATANPKAYVNVNNLILSTDKFINLQKDMHENYNITITTFLDGEEVIVLENDVLQYSRLISSKNEFKAWLLEFIYDDPNRIDYRLFVRSDIEDENYERIRVFGNARIITYDYSRTPLKNVPNKICIYMKEKADGFINGIKVATINVDNANLTELEREKLKNQLNLYF